MMMTMSQIVSARTGGRRCGPRMSGELELTLRNADGSVAESRKIHNLVTRWMVSQIAIQAISATVYVSLTNDPNEWHVWKDLIRHTFTNTSAQSTTFSVNYSSKTWTASTTFAAPATPRTVYGIALGEGAESRRGTYGARVGNIYCCAAMSPVIVQGTTQTLEIVYRLTHYKV